MKKNPSKTGKDEIKQAALRFLAAREHSRLELKQKLERRYDPVLVRSVLDELSARNMQSDHRFAQSYVRHRYQQGYGPIKIALELQQKGIAKTLISSSLQQDELNWQDRLCRLADKKFGQKPALNWSEKAKRQRFLAQRGFSSDMIQYYFKQNQ